MTERELILPKDESIKNSDENEKKNDPLNKRKKVMFDSKKFEELSIDAHVDEELSSIEEQKKEENVFLKIKKSLKYAFEFGNERKIQNKDQNFQFLNDIIESEMGFEDEFFTEQLYHKRNISEFCCFYFSIVAMITGIMAHQIKTYSLIYVDSDKEVVNIALNITLVLCTIFNIMFSNF